MIKILKKEDANMFYSALDYYYENTDHVKSGYYPEDRKQWIDIHKDFFSSDLHDDYVVVADIENNTIVGLAIGFRNGLLLDKKYINLSPSWHLAFTWRHETHWTTPKKFIFDITNPISLHMENKGIFDFTKIMRVNLLNLERFGVDGYIDKVYNKKIPDGRYNAYAEHVIRNDEDLKKLPRIMRRIYPNNVLTPLLCVKHSLKNEIRNNYFNTSNETN